MASIFDQNTYIKPNLRQRIGNFFLRPYRVATTYPKSALILAVALPFIFSRRNLLKGCAAASAVTLTGLAVRKWGDSVSYPDYQTAQSIIDQHGTGKIQSICATPAHLQIFCSLQKHGLNPYALFPAKVVEASRLLEHLLTQMEKGDHCAPQEGELLKAITENRANFSCKTLDQLTEQIEEHFVDKIKTKAKAAIKRQSNIDPGGDFSTILDEMSQKTRRFFVAHLKVKSLLHLLIPSDIVIGKGAFNTVFAGLLFDIKTFTGQKAVYYAYKTNEQVQTTLKSFADIPQILDPILFTLNVSPQTYAVERQYGQDLDKYQRDQPGAKLKFGEVFTVAKHALIALDALHKEGWVHRDVKPGNLVWQTDERKAVTLIDCDMLVKTGTTVNLDGTLIFMAPEILGSAWPSIQIDLSAYGILPTWTAKPSADCYSLGMSLYPLLTGQFPLPKSLEGKEGKAMYEALKEYHSSILQQLQLMKMANQSSFKAWVDTLWLRFSNVDPILKHLVAALTTPDEKDRFTAANAIAFLRKHNQW